MLNELHELTAAFIRLAEIRGWRPDNLPMYEAQRRAFVFFRQSEEGHWSYARALVPRATHPT